METLSELQEIAWRILIADSVQERRDLFDLLRETRTRLDAEELETVA